MRRLSLSCSHQQVLLHSRAMAPAALHPVQWSRVIFASAGTLRPRSAPSGSSSRRAAAAAAATAAAAVAATAVATAAVATAAVATAAVALAAVAAATTVARARRDTIAAVAQVHHTHTCSTL